MSKIEIRFAHSFEADDIRMFLYNYWDKDFSVVKSEELFDYLYRDNDRINFVLGIRENKIVAVLGYTFYDKDNPDVFLMLWRSIDRAENTGLKLIQFLQDKDFKSVSSIGVRKEVLIFYKLLGFNVGKMEHYYLPNLNVKDYKIGHFLLDGYHFENIINYNSIVEVSSFSEDFSYFSQGKSENLTFKSFEYLTKRYCRHPIYRYQIYKSVDSNGTVNAYFVTRKCHANDRVVIRLVDIIGDIECLYGFCCYVQSEVFNDESIEYLDMYCINLPNEIIFNSGFVEKKSNDVIPNYFEPFLKQNEDKYYISSLATAMIFKGDGDADRPYRLF